MDEKLKKIINDLEKRYDELNKQYMGTEAHTSGYFLSLGKATELGETIDFIKKHYE